MIKVNLKAQRVVGVVGLAFFLSSGYGWVTEKCTPTTCDSATTVGCSNFGPGWRKCNCKAGYARPNDNATACVSLTQASVNPCAPNNGSGPCDPKSTNCTVGSNPPKAFCNCKPGYIKVNDTMCAVPPPPPPAPVAKSAPSQMSAPTPAPSAACAGKNVGDSITISGVSAKIYQLSPCKAAAYVAPYNRGDASQTRRLAQSWGYGNCSTQFLGATNPDDGVVNTQAIINSNCGLDNSAQVCKELGQGWYMPASNEAGAIYNALKGQPDLNAGLAIMSSTEVSGKPEYFLSIPTWSGVIGTDYRKVEDPMMLFCSQKL